MGKISLVSHMKQKERALVEGPKEGGPFITISRQYGCHGFTVGLLLMEVLNEEAGAEQTWHIYQREILSRLATETNLAMEFIERERLAKPSWVGEFVRSLSGRHIPSGGEIRGRITTIIRGLALEGHTIIVGQGGCWATRDLANGLSVRLEAPHEWRVRQIAARDNMPEAQARVRLDRIERQREYLCRLHESRSRRRTAFDLVYDCSRFTLAQIGQQIAYAAGLKGLLGK